MAKSFRNPALSFLSQESIEQTEKQEEKQKQDADQADSAITTNSRVPRGKKKRGRPKTQKFFRAEEGEEVKSVHVQLIMRPSIAEAGRQKAIKDGLSFNEYIHRLIEEDCKIS